MSMSDKMNNPNLESQSSNDSYNKQINNLENQLSKAKETNNKNIQELSELKQLLSEYTQYIDNLKQSYTNTIDNLKSQLSFEREINEKYLQKIVDSHKELNNDIKSLNTTTDDNIKELSVLLENNNDKLSNKILSEISDKDTSSNTNDSLNCLNELINNNQELIENISEFKKSICDSNKKIIDELNNTKTNKLQLDNSDLTDNIQTLLNNNHKEFSELISNNNDSITSKIIQELNNLNSNDNSENDDLKNEFKSLLEKNRKEISNLISENNETKFNNEDINELSRSIKNCISKDILKKVDETIKNNQQELIDSLNDNVNSTKAEILDKISNDLRNENYINLEAYKKIKDMNLFDEVFYKRSYNYTLDIDPLLHFIYKGYEENKRPRQDFQPLQYKRSNKKIEDSTLNPLVYFVTYGIYEGNIKINDNFVEINHINKKEIDKELESFSDRGVKKSKRKPRIIVSLTSIPERMYDVHYTLYSLLNQQVKPDKVILWLSEDDFPNGEIDLPKEVLKLKNNGLSIRFCEDLRSFKKIIPVLKTYPNDIIVTADDDIYYPSNWLKLLYEDYRRNENDIIAHRVRKIEINDKGEIDDYNNWSLNENPNDYSYLNLPTGAGGVLYPPNCFYKDVLDDKIFKSRCRYSDDIWLWAMAVLNHKKIKTPKNKLNSELIYINPAREKNLTNECSLSKINVLKGYNNTQFNSIIDKYPQILDIIKEEE